MQDDRILPGQLVKSKAGRDSGSIYVVIGFKTPALLLLADGRGRKVTSPKTKNIRHISALGPINKGIAANAASGKTVSDEDIRRAIRAVANIGD